MQTIDEVKVDCRFVGEGIEKAVEEGEDLNAAFEGTQSIRFKVDKEGDEVKVVGGEMGGDDSHLINSERGVTKTYGDEIVGYAFDPETRAALVAYFAALYYT